MLTRRRGGARNFGFAICDFGLGEAEGDKVNLELHTRSQGQSNLVKPKFMLGNLDWLKRDSEILDFGVLAHGHWGKVQGFKCRVQSRGVSGSSGFWEGNRFCSVLLGLNFGVLAHSHRSELKKGNKLKLELRTRSQGWSRSVKPSQT